MQAPNEEQAELLRLIRGRMATVHANINYLATTAALFVCPHERAGHPDSEHEPEVCYVCAVFDQISVALGSVREACELVDAALMRGPHPTAKEGQR